MPFIKKPKNPKIVKKTDMSLVSVISGGWNEKKGGSAVNVFKIT